MINEELENIDHIDDLNYRQFKLAYETDPELSQEEQEEEENYYFNYELPELLQSIAETELDDENYRQKYKLDLNEGKDYKQEDIRRIDNDYCIFGTFTKYFYIGKGKEREEMTIVIDLIIGNDYYSSVDNCLYYRIYPAGYSSEYSYDSFTDIYEGATSEEVEEIKKYIRQETRKIRKVFREHTYGWNKTEGLIDYLELTA